MKTQYSSYEKDKLIEIIEKERYLGDIDCFLGTVQRIYEQLERLKRRSDWCLSKLKEKVGSLEGDIALAEGRMTEAKKIIQNTPTVETVYPSSDSIAKGEQPSTRHINGDIIAKQEGVIREQDKIISDCKEQISILQANERTLQVGYEKLDKALHDVDCAINALDYAKRNANDDCEKVKEVIKYAATCMENYDAIRISYGADSAVSHIQAKDGW